MVECLNEEQLDGLATGSLAAEAVGAVTSHIDQCGSCRDRLAECRTNTAYLAEVKDALTSVPVDANLGDKPDASPNVSSLLRPDGIPGYWILSEVHRGGQGVVYQAIQNATGRMVALKVLLWGTSASVRQRLRFQREIELVAGLNHPNIVTVYDSGLTPDGQPYCAMEYLEGIPLEQYLRLQLKTPTIPARKRLEDMLNLFVKICDAVNHAHQHGVIHRDLKPSHVRIDSNGEPHILDFGIAKIVPHESAEENAPVTVTGEFIGTVTYASPEQVAGNPALTDIRTDVYSLGVILYEMLTGHYPYPVDGQLAEVLRHIATTPPTPPSHWYRHRSPQPDGRAPMPHRIDAELDTIILKALTKERERRYQTAENLAQDVEHYLAGQPIDAKRDSAIYVLRKTVVRHKLAAGLAAAFVLLITSFAVMMSVMYEGQRGERQRADEERSRAVEAQASLADAMVRLGDVAIERGDVNDALAEYLGALAIHEHLAAGNPTDTARRQTLMSNCQRLAGAYHATGRNPEAVAVLNKAIAYLPPGQGRMRQTIEGDLARYQGTTTKPTVTTATSASD